MALSQVLRNVCLDFDFANMKAEFDLRAQTHSRVTAGGGTMQQPL